MESAAHILVQKLEEFIRRYYKNQLLKGTIYSTGILIAAFLTVILLEYFGDFNTLVRSILFFGFLLASISVLVKYILIPLLKLYKIGDRIGYTEAAQIIGNHFNNVEDKLLNVLQLQSQQHLTGSQELLLASINQRIEQLRPVRFTGAVNFSENKRYLKYVIPIFFVALSISIIWPKIITKSTERLVNFQTFYEKEMPFLFQIQNANLQTIQTKDYQLELEIAGEQVPDEVHIRIHGIEYKLEKENSSTFNYLFTNPQTNTVFQLEAAGYLSKEYELVVLPKPSLDYFSLELIFPPYLNRPKENIPNTGDIQIPQGTRVNWTFSTKNTDQLILRFADSLSKPKQVSEHEFGFSRKFNQNNNYTIKPLNEFVLNSPDSVNYNIQVIPDQFPGIEVNIKQDSLNTKNNYFSGMITDDYGFKELTFHYQVFATDSNGIQNESSGIIPLSISKHQISQPFYYFLDASQFNLQSGDKIEYFFEVKDNDGVNGSKSSRTQMMMFKAPSKEEVKEKTEKNNEEIKKDLEESIKKTKQLQKDINEISKKVNDKKQLGYEEKKKIEDLIKKQNELQNKIEQIKHENQLNNKQQNEFSQTDESILEKQKQLEELFDNVMTPEMKKLFDELNKLLEKMDKNLVQEKLDELKLSNKDIEKELDRNLEMFKQLEVQQKMQEVMDKLTELQKKEDDLNKETEGKKPIEEKELKKDNQQKDNSQKEGNQKDKDNKDQKKNKESVENKNENKESELTKDKKLDHKELEKKQEEINKEFDNLKKELKDLEQKNKELEEPNKLPNNEEKQNEISNEMQKSSQELSKNNKKSASKSQKQASDKMEEMKEDMEKAMEENEEQQSEENAQSLRQILENLVNLSFAQEDLIKDLPKTRIDNPQYVAIPKQQNKLKDDSKMIEDSLLALSKRVPQISAMVNREISAIHLNMDKTVSALAERNSGESLMRMQGTMNSVNTLALLLNESLEQMQKQMQEQMKSKSQKKGKCKKPGSGSGKNPSSKGQTAQSLRKMQEQLNKQLQDMKDALEKGQKPGEKPGDKKGEKPGNGLGPNGKLGNTMSGSSEQFAKMAAQQEALRRQMQALMDKMKNKSSNPGGDMANLMEQTEKELVNKQITNETMKRQQDILSRLLESEKAEREREQDEQRKSNEAKNQNLSNPEEFLEYKRLKEKEMELLNTVPPSLTPYFKEKVNNYFNNINK